MKIRDNILGMITKKQIILANKELIPAKLFFINDKILYVQNEEGVYYVDYTLINNIVIKMGYKSVFYDNEKLGNIVLKRKSL